MRISEQDILPGDFKPILYADLPPLRPDILEQFLREQRLIGLYKAALVDRKLLTKDEALEYRQLSLWFRHKYPQTTTWLADEP